MIALLHDYRNGGYRVRLHANGTKIRDEINPSIPPEFPEQMDLKITDWCDAGCAWCHEGSTRRGRHGDIDAMLALLSELPSGVEIAIGGGDPLAHPGFNTLVTGLSMRGLVPSVTVNGRHLARHKDILESLTVSRKIFGIGVSFYQNFPDWRHPHLVDHMIAGIDDPSLLLQNRQRKILVLGYKNWGRGRMFQSKRSDAVAHNIALWYRLLPLIGMRHHLSFDNLAIHQLAPQRLFRSDGGYEGAYMGQEGAFSLYVDGVRREYATSSYAPDRNSWSDIRTMFADVRARNIES